MDPLIKNPNLLSNKGKSVKHHKHSPDESDSKRPRSSSRIEVPACSAIESELTEHWPRFLLVQSQEPVEERGSNSLGRLSPFVVEKAIHGCIGTAVQVKRLRSGDLLVEVTRRTQAENLLKLTQFASVPVTVSPHRALNTSKGVIRSSELAAMDTEELTAELKRFQVIKVDKIMINKNNERKPSNTLILTFCTPTLPASLKVAYLNIKVEPYIPAPLRCYRCQRYGHSQQACKRAPACFKCGSLEHDHSNCSSTPHCISCKGEHPSNFHKCPVWLKEKEICRIKILEKLSYPEARTRVEAHYVTANPVGSYSAAVSAKPKMVTIATQTEVTNCQCSANFIEPERNSELISKSTSTSDLVENVTINQLSIASAARKSSRGRSLSPRTDDRKTQNASPRAPPREHREEKVSLAASQSASAASQSASAASQRREAAGKGGPSGGPDGPPDPGKKGKPPFKPVEAPKGQ